MLNSALDRPLNLFAYSDPPPSISRLASAYGFGITRNHPFIDGNKRTAFVVSLLFLRLNGEIVIASQPEKYDAIISLSKGGMTEQEYANWLHKHSQLL